MVMSTSRQSLANKVIAILAVCLVTILVVLPVHAFISTWGGTAIGPLLVWKSWKEILLAALIPLVIGVCVLRPDVARTVWGRWYNKLIAAYVVMTLVMSVASQASGEAVVAGVLINLRFLAMFVLAQVVLASGLPWVEKFKKRLATWLVTTGTLLAVIAFLQVTVLPKDFLAHFGYNKDTTIAPFMVIDDNPDALRAFATMRGPNTFASYLLLPLAVALLLWWHNRKQWWMAGSAVLMAAAIFATHSRSGWLGAAVMTATLAFVALPREALIKWLKFGTVPAIILVGVVMWLATTVPAIRLAVFHSGGNDVTESLTEGSSDKHWRATAEGTAAIVREPLGTGVGSAGPASFYTTNSGALIPENYFVQIGQEVGVVGLVIFIAMSVGIARELWRRRQNVWPQALFASFIGIQVINIFLHGWADDPTAMTWWALAGLVLGTPPVKKVKSK